MARSSGTAADQRGDHGRDRVEGLGFGFWRLLRCWPGQVGPLPISPDTTAEMLYQPGEVPWLKRPQSDMAERTAMQPILDDTNAILTPLFMAVVGTWLNPKL